MNKTIWQMPVPASSILKGPSLNQLHKRQVEMSFFIEGDDDSEKRIALLFEGVESYKVTHLTSLGSINRELRSQAYGTVISVALSPWLNEVRNAYVEYCLAANQSPKELQHLMTFFDDGPCCEFICTGFKVS